MFGGMTSYAMDAAKGSGQKKYGGKTFAESHHLLPGLHQIICFLDVQSLIFKPLVFKQDNGTLLSAQKPITDWYEIKELLVQHLRTRHEFNINISFFVAEFFKLSPTKKPASININFLSQLETFIKTLATSSNDKIWKISTKVSRSARVFNTGIKIPWTLRKLWGKYYSAPMNTFSNFMHPIFYNKAPWYEGIVPSIL